MDKLQKTGCSKQVVNLAVPLGYSFNLGGTNIYHPCDPLHPQALNIDLTSLEQLTIFSVAMLSPKETSDVTGPGFVTLAGTVTVVPSVPMGAWCGSFASIVS